jgi:hypothetical protein
MCKKGLQYLPAGARSDLFVVIVCPKGKRSWTQQKAQSAKDQCNPLIPMARKKLPKPLILLNMQEIVGGGALLFGNLF